MVNVFDPYTTDKRKEKGRKKPTFSVRAKLYAKLNLLLYRTLVAMIKICVFESPFFPHAADSDYIN